MEKVKSTRAKKKSSDTAEGQALPSSFKKFRQLPEIEAFYRFVYENDLRKEGKKILERIILQRKAEKLSTKAKKRKIKLNS
tara:strand:- start:7970 stop:8212 length:243 start_codon:yes stop_codon:yes gene_type:complete